MQQALARARGHAGLPPGVDKLRAQSAITATLVNMGNMLDDNGVGLGTAAPRRRPPTATRWPVPTRSWPTRQPSPRWRPRCRRSTPAITRKRHRRAR